MNPRIIAAQADVATARETLIDTARELQQRLAPRTLARDAWESAKVKSADLAEDAVDAVKRRPVATGGVVAAIAMFIARQPLKDGVVRLYDAMTSRHDECRTHHPQDHCPQTCRQGPGAKTGTAAQTQCATPGAQDGEQVMSANKKTAKTPTLADKAGDAIDGARERAITAYDSARDSAAAAGKQAGDQFAEAPLAVIAGGIAAGAILAALLPIGRREKDLLAPVTDNIKDRASAAVEAAKTAGQARLGELGLTRDAGGEAVRSIVDGVAQAIKSSAQAAAGTVRRD